MTANLILFNPFHQIVSQKIQPLNLETDEKKYFETDVILFEDERFQVESTLEISLNSDPNGKEVRKVKAHVWNIYDSAECEDVSLNENDLRSLEKFYSENLIINL